MARKTAEEKADEQRRYALARVAEEEADFEPFFSDPNQAIRAVAAGNPAATVLVLDRFAFDRFWGVQVAVVLHRNVARETLLRLVAGNPKSRGVVYSEARKRLETDGVLFDNDGFAIDS
ncbi:hypothetical protein [Galactobacter caseinivorans]|uniref:Uncharacterized protein n=1 Tax=Galactobacter caseinivorans TaxID=2676123 RepID=A0A496PM48_9MICC|nr:hypothetical protein [Galactobacter caseinivorans]RKW71536.1 hypothetical protein DWQ67_01430 [Galactobacter caseinivorans]